MAAAGFCLAATNTGVFAWSGFIGVVAGTALVIASACVVNNYIDRGIDSKMKRTRKRALVTHEITAVQAFILAGVLLLAGVSLLVFLTSWLVVTIGVLAWVSYVGLYTWAKRKTPFGTLIGTLPGGLPPVAGYVATGRLDIAALLLFLILFAWQMAHFYSIAMRRREEYKAAGMPVWPVVYGMRSTRRQIIGFIMLFMVAGIALTTFGYTGITFAVVIVLLGGRWLLKGRGGMANEAWAKQMFLFSLIVLLVTIVMIALGGLLP